MYNLIICPKGYNMHSPGCKLGVNGVTVFNPDGVAQKIMHVPPRWGRTCNNFTPSLLPGDTQVKSPSG